MIGLQASRKGQLTDTIKILNDSTFTYIPLLGAVGTDTITLSFVNELGVQGAVCLVFKLSNPNVEVLINGNDTLSVCGNFSSTLTPSISGGLPPITYLWSTGAMTPTLPVVVNTSTTYSLVVTDSIGCKDTAFVRINVDTQAPTITCPAPQMVSCTSLIPPADTNLVLQLIQKEVQLLELLLRTLLQLQLKLVQIDIFSTEFIKLLTLVVTYLGVYN